MPDLGGWEWVILAVVALVLFGGAKLADVGKNAGKAIREFKEETAAARASDPPAVTATATAPVAETTAPAPVASAAPVTPAPVTPAAPQTASGEEKAVGA